MAGGLVRNRLLTNGNYKMHDPWYGPDLDFNSRYNTGMIKSIRLFTK